MNKLSRIILLALMLALFAALPASAQTGTFGLSEEDFQLFTGANAISATQTQYSFDYEVVLTVEGAGIPVDVALAGTGALDLDSGVLSLTADGGATVAGQTTPLEGELRVVGDFIYARATDPTTDSDTGWFSLNTAEFDEVDLGSAAFGDELADAFLEGFAQGAGVNQEDLDMAAFEDMLDALSRLNPEGFISITRGKDIESDALFIIDFSLSDLATAPGMDEVTAALLRASAIAPEAGAGFIDSFNQVLAESFADTSITFEQQVNTESNLVQQATFTIDSTIDPTDFDGSGGPISTLFTLDITLDDYGSSASVTAPADAIEVPSSAIADALGLDAAPAAVPDAAPPAQASGEGISVGESVIVTLEPGGTVELPLSADGTVTITAVGRGGADTILRLYDADGNLIAENDDQSGNFGNLGVFDSAIEDVEISGDAVIEVAEFGDVGGDVEVTVLGDATAAAPDVDSGDMTVQGEAVELTCTSQALDFEGDPGTTFTGTCPAGCTEGALWGTDVYTDDSTICTAAIHAGAIPESGGDVTFSIEEGQEAYPASTQNAIDSSDWGSWGRSFSFGAAGSAAAPDMSTDEGSDDDMMVQGEAVELTCTSQALDFEGDPGTAFTGTCPAGCTDGALWGTDVYTDDSSVCTAAIHAGAIPESGGEVTFTIEEGMEAYPASTQNAIDSSDWGSWGRSFSFGAAGSAAAPDMSTDEGSDDDMMVQGEAVDLTCDSQAQSFEGDPGTAFTGTCPAGCTDGALWGTDVYTDDSSVCTAAIHAGAIPESGGEVTFTIEEGMEEYPASSQNGIDSSDWGSWGRSFSFGAAGSAAMPDMSTDEGDAEASTGGTMEVTTDLPNSYTFSNGVSFAYPEGYEIQSEADVVTVVVNSETQRALIQAYETKVLFGEMDMGMDFMKQTYGATAATTWGFDFSPDDFQDVEVNGRPLSVLEFEGMQTGEPVIGAVAIVEYTDGGYGYVIGYALSPVPENFIEDTLAVAVSMDS